MQMYVRAAVSAAAIISLLTACSGGGNAASPISTSQQDAARSAAARTASSTRVGAAPTGRWQAPAALLSRLPIRADYDETDFHMSTLNTTIEVPFGGLITAYEDTDTSNDAFLTDGTWTCTNGGVLYAFPIENPAVLSYAGDKYVQHIVLLAGHSGDCTLLVTDVSDSTHHTKTIYIHIEV